MAWVQDVAVPLSDGSAMPAALALLDRPAAGDSGPSGPRRPAVLVVHEALGLNDDIRRIAARFADAGYVALAPDFLAGLGPRPFCIARFARGIGRVATGRPYRQLGAAQAWLSERSDVDAARIGVAGFCMGGGFALLYAAAAEVQVVAPFYGAVPKDDAALAGVCPVVASFGGRDRIFGGGGARLAAALDRLGVDHDVVTYPDAGHSFLNEHAGLVSRIEPVLPTRGRFDPAAAEDAWRRTLAFFDRHLGPQAVVAGGLDA
jgi:carboxymethylenebutenolidase